MMLGRAHEVVGDRRAPRMRRWYLWKSWRDARLARGLPVRWVDRVFDFNVCIHEIRQDDPPGLHDHSWWNATVVLRGRLVETNFIGASAVVWRERVRAGWTHVRYLLPGTVRVRRACDAHRLELALAHSPAWTLFITGPWRREWGYWRDGIWVDWRLA